MVKKTTAYDNDTDNDTETAVPSQYVYLCDVSRRELFMLPVAHTNYTTCDRCGAVSVQCFQYLRSDLRLDHLAAADRDAFNAKLDVILADSLAAIAAQEAFDAAVKKEADDRLAAEIAANDAAYAAAVAARHALDTATATE